MARKNACAVEFTYVTRMHGQYLGSWFIEVLTVSAPADSIREHATALLGQNLSRTEVCGGRDAFVYFLLMFSVQVIAIHCAIH